MLQNLRNYMSAESRAIRQRADERKELCAELRGIKTMRVYGYSREPRIIARIAELDGRAVSLRPNHAMDGLGYSFDTPREGARA